MNLNLEEIKKVSKELIERKHKHYLQFIFLHKDEEVEPVTLMPENAEDLAKHNTFMRKYVNKRKIKEYVIVAETLFHEEKPGGIKNSKAIMIQLYREDMYTETHIIPFTIQQNNVIWYDEIIHKKGDGIQEVSKWNFYVEDCFEEKLDELMKNHDLGEDDE